MALPHSSVSRVTRAIVDFVSDSLDAANHSIRVTLGNPAQAAPAETDTEHRINLFFYRFESGGFDADVLPGDPWRLRLHCLITAFGVQDDQVGPGENDLRLIGEVMRVFHETPVLPLQDVEGASVRVQAIFQPLTADEINHLWSTQGDVTYRVSAAYEFALAPVMPRERALGSPLVGQLGHSVHGVLSARDETFQGQAVAPPVAAHRVDATRDDWAPRICWVRDGQCSQSLAFPVGSPELAGFVPQVWAVGASGASVQLAWQAWTAQAGWESITDPVSVVVATDWLDPERVNDAALTPLVLPFSDQPGQLLLHAQRSYTRAVDGHTLTVRSNPLLVTLYEDGV
ncbi:MAG: DUF4255 domain-containing protein [Pseudomonadota bacterium]|nr:DUF4255 domain-containing protein [Pseudomonadota bacterium]